MSRVLELKSAAYDAAVQLQIWQRRLAQLNQAIAEEDKKPKEEVQSEEV